jgi:hypothetical protein
LPLKAAKIGVFSMKRTFKVLGIIALLAIIGFSMAACSGDSTVAPTLTSLIMVEYKAGVPPTETPKSSFSINEQFFLYAKVTAGDLDVTKFVFTIKGGTEPWVKESTLSTPYPAGSANFGFATGASLQKAGSYTLEAYAVDSKGNKSNTLTFAFEIK